MGAGISLARSIFENGQPLEGQQPLQALLHDMKRRWYSEDDSPHHPAREGTKKKQHQRVEKDLRSERSFGKGYHAIGVNRTEEMALEMATNSAGFSKEAKHMTDVSLPAAPLARTLVSESATPKTVERQVDSMLVQNPGSLRCGDRPNENMHNDDPVLHSNHKIFLSHSGYQKDFVEELCGDLEKRYHFPFFDRRPSSLPKGERFPELILKAARVCQMAVVVLSEEYFTSKWPMIELNTFVQTRLMQEEQKLDTKLKILPLFYGLSLLQFGNEQRRARWYRKWEIMAKDDSRIDIKEWKKSLRVLASFNGIEYHQVTNAVSTYREDIVSNICNEVPSDIKWDDSHVQGGSNICQAIQNNIAKIQASTQHGVCLIGIYGIGGIGKTTICKTLCNKLFQEFKGKVSHVELGNQSFEQSMKKVLKDLSNVNQDLIELLGKGECEQILRENMYEQKTFLAIDNVWPESKSIEEAKKFLRPNFCEKSVVMVTSRTLETLLFLGVNSSHCFEMPSLEYKDAKNLFLYHAAYGIEFINSNDKCVIEKCLALCYFLKNDTRHSHNLRKEATRRNPLSHSNLLECQGHYLPLALKALGMQLSCIGNTPSKWIEVLSKVKDFNYLQEEQNPVFSILRISFDRLGSVIDQSLFMDLVLYSPSETYNHVVMRSDFLEWLSFVYNQDFQEITERLLRLQARGLLEDVNLPSQRVCVHDLYREFARLEATGKLNESIDFQNRKRVYYENTYPAELEMTPSYKCWQNLTRIAIKNEWHSQRPIQSLQRITWKYFANVLVLKLDRLWKLRGDLNLKGLNCLRSLELIDINSLDNLDGLEDLNNLTYFRWANFGYEEFYNVFKTSVRTRMGKLPSSLQVLQVAAGALFPPDVFTYCSTLSKLELIGSFADNLDFSNCTGLQSVILSHLQLLKTVSGLTEESTCSLQSLTVTSCFDLVEIPGLGNMVGLQLLHLNNNYQLRELPDLQKLTGLQVLNISKSKFEQVPGLGSLQQLRELTWTDSYSSIFRSINLPNLSGLKKLEVVNFSYNYELSSLEDIGIGDLPALRCLDLSGCWSLRQLPDMCGSRNLKKLDISWSGIELREEEERMLAHLQPVVTYLYTGPQMLVPSIPVDDGRYKWNDWVRTCPWLKFDPC